MEVLAIIIASIFLLSITMLIVSALVIIIGVTFPKMYVKYPKTNTYLINLIAKFVILGAIGLGLTMLLVTILGLISYLQSIIN